MSTACHTDLHLYKRLARQARPYWPHIAGIFVLDLLASPFGLLGPLPLKIAVDSAIGQQPLPGFLQALLPAAGLRSSGAVLALATGVLMASALLSQLRGLVSSLLRAYTGEKLVLGFRAQLFRHAQRLSVSYHDMKGTADSPYRIQNDAASIQYVSMDG